jgi:hypothetical protein
MPPEAPDFASRADIDALIRRSKTPEGPIATCVDRVVGAHASGACSS